MGTSEHLIRSLEGWRDVRKNIIIRIGNLWWVIKIKSFSLFYKEGVEDNCLYNTRLDTYGCGCQHDCNYCYAKSLLDFRGLWNPQKPVVANMKQVRNAIIKAKKKGIKVLRLGGMTDCFQPLELKYRTTYQTIKLLNKYKMGYLIITKSHLVADDEYIKIYDKDLAHFQITTTCIDDNIYKELKFEKASLPSKRVEAIEKLQNLGFDVAIRLSPYVPELIKPEEVNKIKCNKLLIEFLRVNHWVEKWFGNIINIKDYSKNYHGYNHLPFEKKKDLVKDFKIKEVQVCDFEEKYLDYWKKEFNYNKEDCCNLRS